MANLLSDKEILTSAYARYIELVKDKQSPVKKKQAKAKASELIQKADRILVFFNKPSSTIPENKKLLQQAKVIYQQFLFLKNSYPDCVTGSLDKKMSTLLDQMVDFESERIAHFKLHEVGGEKINVEAIFTNDEFVRQLINQPVETILKEAFQDRRFSIISKEDRSVYITNTGMKYHRADCPFCKRVKLIKTSFAKVENAGYTACRCIDLKNKVNLNKENLSENDKTLLSKKTITVFIDESLRTSPISQIDPTYNKKQASYSYIICKGYLESEDEITPRNTLSSRACLANEANDVTYSAIEESLFQ